MVEQFLERLKQERDSIQGSHTNNGCIVSSKDKFIASNAHNVHKLKAKDSTGRWAYYFVYVPRHKESIFLNALKSDTTIDLDEYGSVLASSYGEYPNEEVITMLSAKYGWDVESLKGQGQ